MHFFKLIVAISADTAIVASSALQRYWFIGGMRNISIHPSKQKGQSNKSKAIAR
jgi:hypothetical protein